MEGTPKQEINTGYDLIILRLDHAMDALDDDELLSDEVRNITASRGDPEVVDSFLRKNEASLSSTQKEYLQASIAIKTWRRNRDADPGLKLAELRYEHAFKSIPADELTDEISDISDRNPDIIDTYLRKNDSDLTATQKEYLQASMALETKKREFN